jgi:hypothetical protein
MSTCAYRWLPPSILVLSALVVTASGCGGGVKKVTINGTVSYKGQPVSGGMLQFAVAKGAPAAAPIQEDGSFTMTDVTPGEVTVSITATPRSSGPGGGKAKPAPKVTPADLPEKYQDPARSGLKYTITPTTRQLDIKMD